MRQQSAVQVTVRGVVIGGNTPVICLPMVGDSKLKILLEAAELVSRLPDLLEWRIDAYDKVEDLNMSLSCLQELRQVIDNIPLIFTCRIDQEGGLRKISQAKRLELYIAVIESGNVDIVDIELCNENDFIKAILEQATASNVKVILSHHNFHKTPSDVFIYEKLVKAQQIGADIAKLAAMPQTYGDVLTLLCATNKARNEAVDIPIITMSMGPLGAVSRLVGGLFGSDLTFAQGMQASAPGQLPIEDLKAGMNLLNIK